MHPLNINEMDLTKLKVGETYQHVNCQVAEFIYDNQDKLTFIAKRLKVHPFGMKNSAFREEYNPNDWQTKKHVCLTFHQYWETAEEYTFLVQLEERIKQLVKDNTDMMAVIVPRQARLPSIDPMMRLEALGASSSIVKPLNEEETQRWPRREPHFKVGLPLHKIRDQVHDRYKFTIRDGITGSILDDFKPSAGNELMVGNDRLSAVLQLDRVVAYHNGLSIQLTLFQGKLYSRTRLHELPRHHMFRGVEPGRFPEMDLLEDDSEDTNMEENGQGASSHNATNQDYQVINEDEPAIASSCPVCLTEAVATVVDCGHAFCRACALTLTTCGVCRAYIAERRPLYLV